MRIFLFSMAGSARRRHVCKGSPDAASRPDPDRIGKEGGALVPIRLFPSFTSTMSAGSQFDRSNEPAKSAIYLAHPSTVFSLTLLYTMNEKGVNSLSYGTVHHNSKGRQLAFGFICDTVHHEAKRRQLQLLRYCTLYTEGASITARRRRKRQFAAVDGCFRDRNPP